LTLSILGPNRALTLMPAIPEIIYIDARVRGLPTTHRILAGYPDVQTELITDVGAMRAAGDFVQSKHQWFLTQTPKKWYRACRQKDGTTLIVADFVLNTPYDCSYAETPLLMGRRPFFTVFVNIEEALADLGRRCAATPGHRFRLRCGTLADALAMEPATKLLDTLVPFFAWTPNATLELWTRSHHIDALLNLPHHGRTVVGFSLTPQSIINAEESGTASVEERLDAACALHESGFPLAVAIDPIVQYPGWEDDYHALLTQLFARLPTEAVQHIELSCFHYRRGLANIATARFPQSRIFFGELVPVNGCYRYLRPIRQQVYDLLEHAIHTHAAHMPITITHEHGIDANKS
jgi:spore photoproduct lyase